MPRGAQTRQRKRIGRQPRPNSSQRGYGRRWREYARRFRQKHPLCVRCWANGLTVPSECVDHVVPVSGPNDPLFWRESNHQALCWKCHSVKTATEDRGKGRGRQRGGATGYTDFSLGIVDDAQRGNQRMERSAILMFRSGVLDSEPPPVSTELCIHMDERGRCEDGVVIPELPGNDLIHVEVGHVVCANGKRYEVSGVRPFPPKSREGVFASVRACVGWRRG